MKKVDLQDERKTVNLENYLEQISTGKKNYDLSSTEKIDDKNAYIIINDQYKFLLKDKENGDVEITYEGVAVSGDLTLSSYEGTYTYPNSGTFTVTNNASGGELTVSSDAPNIATASIEENTVTVVPGTTAGKANIIVKSASWGGYSYTISTKTELKEYYISQKDYDGPFGTKDVLSAKGSGNERFDVMALSDYSSSTYVFSNAQITSGEWSTPTIEKWIIFAGKLGITTTNYNGYGLQNYYWTSTRSGSLVSGMTNGTCISFSKGETKYGVGTGNHYYVRLSRTF